VIRARGTDTDPFAEDDGVEASPAAMTGGDGLGVTLFPSNANALARCRAVTRSQKTYSLRASLARWLIPEQNLIVHVGNALHWNVDLQLGTLPAQVLVEHPCP
jgi:hypothetical protein